MWYAKLVVGFLAALADVSPSQDPNEEDTLVSDQRKFRIPCKILKEPEKVKEVRLFVSRDMGKSWKLCDHAAARRGDFIFLAPEKGLYWLAIQILHTDGSLTPMTPADFHPDLKMKLIDESKPSWAKHDEECLARLRKLRKNWVIEPETQEILRRLENNIAALEARKKAFEKARAEKTNPEKK